MRRSPILAGAILAAAVSLGGTAIAYSQNQDGAGGGSGGTRWSSNFLQSARQLLQKERMAIRLDVDNPASALLQQEVSRYFPKVNDAWLQLNYDKDVVASMRNYFEPKRGTFRDAEIHGKFVELYAWLDKDDGPVKTLRAARKSLLNPSGCYWSNYIKNTRGQSLDQACESALEGTLGSREGHQRQASAAKVALQAVRDETLAALDARKAACAGKQAAHCVSKASTARNWVSRVMSAPRTGLISRAERAEKDLSKPAWDLLSPAQRKKAESIAKFSRGYVSELNRLKNSVEAMLGGVDIRGPVAAARVQEASEAMAAAATAYEKLTPSGPADVSSDQKSSLLAEAFSDSLRAESKVDRANDTLKGQPPKQDGPLPLDWYPPSPPRGY